MNIHGIRLVINQRKTEEADLFLEPWSFLVELTLPGIQHFFIEFQENLFAYGQADSHTQKRGSKVRISAHWAGQCDLRTPFGLTGLVTYGSHPFRLLSIYMVYSRLVYNLV